MSNEKKFVDNDVFEFSIYLKDEFARDTEVVYTKPFENNEIITDEELAWDALKKRKKYVQDKYFTKEKIAELKKKLIDKIMDSKNPFDISCTDYDGGYNVTEDELFDLEK